LRSFRRYPHTVLTCHIPIDYELDPGILEKGIQWITLRLKNVGDVSLHNLDIKMHSTDSLQISFRIPSDYIYRLTPIEETYLHFQLDVHGATGLYISIRYFKEGGSFHWDSPWIREQVHGEAAELEGICMCQILTVL
jgi:hypothetical protein